MSRQYIINQAVGRGKEFACHEKLENTHGIQVYFGVLNSSWQRGENTKNLLREFLPHDFATDSEEELFHVIDLINNRPRKCLEWKIAYESFMMNCRTFFTIHL
ncbi:IS30 family transposase [Paenibacillus popilliae]|uniref:IS30 family transposase n=1 Tax=Paenibacillus popilliae TaxID=78057 RepID=A0ABY3AIF7_PAEPP|nr:IS30 family transposase [Paenibacillus sp. SDF0028]TQR41808.1 IS30 family transposase [Paenibacillus sp. SDF0028]